MDFEKLKEFVEREFRWIKPTDTKDDVETSTSIAFGAVQFYSDCHPDQYKMIDEWWMTQRDKFWELKRKAPAKKEWKRVDK